MKIPKKDRVKPKLLRILKKRGILTQWELTEILGEDLNTLTRTYSISGKRARQISVEMPDIKILTETRKGDIPKQCPCCDNDLKRFHMKNLYGKKFLFRLLCNKCGYEGKDGKWMPKRYNFIFSPSTRLRQ